jgi:hypothetical protein
MQGKAQYRKSGIFGKGSKTRKVDFEDKRQALFLHVIVEGCKRYERVMQGSDSSEHFNSGHDNPR